MAVDRDIFVDVFGEIVDSMRTVGAITASSEVSGVYTLTSANTFNALESVKINSVDYVIKSATADNFTIKAETGLDFTGDAWQSLAPYYMYGHPREIENRLNLKGESKVNKFRQWPLIYLRTDIKQSHGEYKNILYELDSFTVYIITPTKSTYTSPEKVENIYKPILYPLYNDLLDKMKVSRAIAKNGVGIDHDHYDRYGWGNETEYGNDGLIFSRYLDAMEVVFNNIRIYEDTNKCQ